MIAHFKKSGFTLVELILTIVVIGIIAGVSAKILLSGIDTYSFVTSRKDITQHARVGMDRIVDELTLLRWYDITWMSNSRLSFVDRQGRATSFKSDTMNGQPVIVRGNDFLAGLLGFLDFDYLKADDSSTSFSWQMKKINVEFQLDALGNHGSITLRSEVYPRNNMYDDFSAW